MCKAYIPPERKIPGVGAWRWAMPPTPGFCIGDTNMLVSKMWKFAFPDAKLPTPNLKFALALTPNPDASQWNIAGVGSQRKMLALAMYISCFLCRFHLRLYPTRTQFPVEYGLAACYKIQWPWWPHILREKYINNEAKPEILVNSLKPRPRMIWVCFITITQQVCRQVVSCQGPISLILLVHNAQ